MMNSAVVVLLIGLVLLAVAAGLFLCAAKLQKQPKAGGAQDVVPAAGEDVGSVGTAAVPDAPAPVAAREDSWGSDVPSADDAAERAEAAASVESVESAESVEPEEPADSAEPAEAPATPATPATEPVPGPETPAPEEPAAAEPAQEEKRESTGGLFAGRRSRRQWAQSHGYEYAKEDRYLPSEWPESLMAVVAPDADSTSATGGAVARDLVSGFTGGHQFHIGEVNGVTVVALRRDVYSPVQVHLSDGEAMPAGMRHSELCDRPPYTGYSTDNRALDRMLDSRAESALRAVSGAVSDVALSGTWLALKMSRRTDPPIWDHVLIQARGLVAASRVLPPRVTSQELDLTNADPTRPRVHGPVPAEDPDDAATAEAQQAQDAPSDDAPAQRGHLRAVPDAGDGGARQAQPAREKEPDEPVEQDPPERPRMERSSTPVDFPTRSEAQSMGDTSTFADPEEVDAEPIPAVGEDPDHSRTMSGGGPRVIRSTDHEATIFDDGDGDSADDGSGTDDGGTASTSVVSRRSSKEPSRGRHRAPDARHARDADHTGEYPVVDAEIVDPDGEPDDR